MRCPRCGGTWFDKGETQAFYGILEDKWLKTEGAPPRPQIGPRRPTAGELEAWLGPDRSPAHAVVGALLLAGLTMLLFEPARSPGFGPTPCSSGRTRSWSSPSPPRSAGGIPPPAHGAGGLPSGAD